MTSRVLGVIPARGGSKGIPDKNLKPLAGRSLIEYARDAAIESQCVDRLVLSTDVEAIASLGRDLGIEVPFLRPSELADDQSPMQPVIEHAVRHMESLGMAPELIVTLQPTAPLRRGEHIRRAVELARTTDCSSVVSVVSIPAHYSPAYAMRIRDNGVLENYLPEGAGITRRQDAPAAFSRDGTVYVVRRNILLEDHDLYGPDCRALVIDRNDSINLDTEEDWRLAEHRLKS
jgi:CMP-N,N'-diacetyllegionaminic acid synthase